MKTNEKVSFTELKTYSDCPRKWYYEYIKGLRSPNNIYSICGNAIHEAIDLRAKGEKASWITMCKRVILWCREQNLSYKKECKELLKVYSAVFDFLNENFKGCTIHRSELKLKEEIEEGFYFKGFIDLILKNREGKYFVIDFKLTSNSYFWRRYKGNDKLVHYQITLYKDNFCKKEGVKHKDVETFFVLLFRTPSKKDGLCEAVRITSGPKKIKNANKWLNTNVYNMKKGKTIKRFGGTCKFCHLRGTKNCP